jgi:hypothetical protein
MLNAQQNSSIRLNTALRTFQIENESELGADLLTREDWDELKKLATFLPPFKDLTILLQGHCRNRPIWLNMGDSTCHRAPSRARGTGESGNH